MVFWFYGCLVYGFMVLWFYGFLVSKNYQISISCIQEDIAPIFMIARFHLTDLRHFVVPIFSKSIRNWVSEFLIFINLFFVENVPILSDAFDVF